MKTCIRLVGLAALGTLLVSCAVLPPSDVSGDNAELIQAIHQRLASDPVAARYPVGFLVRDGVVTLEGSVPDRPTRMRILAVVRSTPGVREVVDRLYGW